MNWIAVKSSYFWRVKLGTILVDPVEWSCPCGGNEPLFRGATRNGGPLCGRCRRNQAPRDAAPKKLFIPLDNTQLGVTEEEVRKLYEPSLKPVKENQNA